MDLQIRYGTRTQLTDEEIHEIFEISQEHGDVRVDKWEIRAGAIDLVTFLELTFLSFVAKPILDGFFKGFFGEEFFKKLGLDSRRKLTKEIDTFRIYLLSLYKVFIIKKLEEKDAISIVEHIDGVVYYAVLNHKKSTKKLIERLPDALVRAVGEISLNRIPIEHPNVIQLYPNFETESWDYLFMPTVSAFGNYIDRYFDFRTNQMITINSREEFYKKFEIDDEDIYKFIISARFHEERN